MHDDQCGEGMVCDPASHACGKERRTFGERLLDIIESTLSDTEKLFTVVAALVAGLGFGVYQLRGRISQKKKEEEFEVVRHYALKQQPFPDSGGQWQGAGQQASYQQPQAGWNQRR